MFRAIELVAPNKGLKEGDEFIDICYVEKCDKCNNLYKQIPELEELFAI